MDISIKCQITSLSLIMCFTYIVNLLQYILILCLSFHHHMELFWTTSSTFVTLENYI